MVRTKLMSLLSISVIVAILLAVGPVHVVADDSSYTGGDRGMSGDKSSYGDRSGGSAYDKDKYGTDSNYRMDRDSLKDRDAFKERMGKERMGYGRMHKEPRDIYMAVTAGGMTGDTATFTINGVGMMGKDDMAVVATFGTPLAGTYNATSDMGYISTAGAMPLTLSVDTAANTSMPVGSSSAIIGLHDIKVLVKEKGYKIAEFGSISVYTPDGKVKFFKLDRPVKLIHSMDRQMIVIDAYPSFTKRMAGVFSSSAATNFVASQQPVTIAGLMAADRTATAETIGYETPAYVEPPA